jgi:hypothetical protein
MGVDASASVGSPIYAPAASTLVEVLPWFDGPCGMRPLMLFHFAQEQAGTEDGDQYWYVAEQITPVTDTIGATFARGQPVARFAARCTSKPATSRSQCCWSGRSSPAAHSRHGCGELRWYSLVRW